MKLSFILVLACSLFTSCATFGDPGDTVEFCPLATAMFCIIVLMLSTPKLYWFLSLFSNNTYSYDDEIQKDLEKLGSNEAKRADLRSYHIANHMLFASFCIPICCWIIVLMGAGGFWSNVLGLIIGVIVAIPLSKNYFLFNRDNYTISIIIRIILLVMAIICFAF